MFRTKKYCQQLRISKRNISTTAPTFLAEAVFACYSDYYEGNPQNVFIVSNGPLRIVKIQSVSKYLKSKRACAIGLLHHP